MLDLRNNKREQSILMLRNNNLVGIKQSLIYIYIHNEQTIHTPIFRGSITQRSCDVPRRHSAVRQSTHIDHVDGTQSEPTCHRPIFY